MIAPKSLRDGAAEPLEGHLAVYLTQLAGGGDSGDWVRTVGYRLRILLRECAWVYGRDINAKSFLRWRDGVTAPAARTTKNQYVDAVCMFCGWLADGGILSHSPLSRGLLRIDGRGVEPSRKRRALTDAEFGRLLFGAGAFKPFIVVASLTGLRRGEMKKLRRGDVRLDAPVPFLKVRGSTTKNGKPVSMPLRSDGVAELRKVLGDGGSDLDPVFADVPDMDEWRELLAKAGIPYKDDLGRQADVHSLRKKFNTDMSRCGVSKDVQKKAMRVSDWRLVDDVYLDLNQIAIADAFERLPRFDEVEAVAVVVTGTGGGVHCPAQCPAPTVPMGQSLSKPVMGSGGGVVQKGLISQGNCPTLSILAENAEMRHVGLEPTTR